MLCCAAQGLNSSKPLKEQIRENKRELSRAVRELERERVKLERQEAKVSADIRKAAKENQIVRVSAVGAARVHWVAAPIVAAAVWASVPSWPFPSAEWLCGLRTCVVADVLPSP